MFIVQMIAWYSHLVGYARAVVMKVLYIKGKSSRKKHSRL